MASDGKIGASQSGGWLANLWSGLTSLPTTVTDAVDHALTNLPLIKELPQVVDAFEQTVGLKREPPEPALAANASSDDHYSDPATGPLFPKTPSPAEVIQGGLGDCYFMGSLASLAEQHPDYLQKAIQKNPDGTYTVTLYKPAAQKAFKAFGPWGVGSEGTIIEPLQGFANWPLEMVTVTVDGRLPADGNGNRLYAQSPSDGALWPAIMEKAFAKLWGGYDMIGDGSSGTTGSEALAPGKAHTYYLNSSLLALGLGVRWLPNKPSQDVQDAIFEHIDSALKAGQLVTASSYWKELSDYMSGIVSNHLYTVVGVENGADGKHVMVRNPWGNNPSGDTGDGVVRLSIGDFIEQFLALTISDVPGEPATTTQPPQAAPGPTPPPPPNNPQPPPNTQPPPGTAPPPPNVAPPPAPSRDYVVARGDTLWAIATAHGLTLPALEKANPQIANFNLIYPGQVIHLPAPPSAPAPAGPAPAAPDPSTNPGFAAV